MEIINVNVSETLTSPVNQQDFSTSHILLISEQIYLNNISHVLLITHHIYSHKGYQ